MAVDLRKSKEKKRWWRVETENLAEGVWLRCRGDGGAVTMAER